MGIYRTVAVAAFCQLRWISALQLPFAPSAFKGDCYQHQHQHHKRTSSIHQAIAKNVASVFVAGSLVFGSTQPVCAVDTAVSGPLQQAIIEAGSATYSLLETVDGDALTPFADKLSNVVSKKLNADKLANAADSAADAVLAVSDDRLSQFVAIVEGAYKGVSSDTCRTIAIPKDAIKIAAESDGIRKLSPEKVALVRSKLEPLQRAVPKTDSGVCLPNTPEDLEQIWIGQTELLLSVPKAAKRELSEKASAAFRAIPNAELLRLLPETKKVLGSVDRKIASKFQQAAQALDRAIRQDPRFQLLQSVK